MLGLAAATCSPALAESGDPEFSLAAVPELAVAVTALEEAGLGDVALPELEPVTAPEPSMTLPAVPAQETAAKPASAGAVAAPPPEPEIEPTAAPEPATPRPDAPAPEAPPPAVEQTQPANVNVTVRVDSPGDNGSVDQANAAAAAAPATETQYRPEPPQYQEPIPAASTPAADAAPEQPAETGSGWDWDWTWNCVDPPLEPPAVPVDATHNWTWNWNWDCDGEELPPENAGTQSGPQYQPTVAQYRPININISIRINSPGNDGPVRQTNTAVAVLPITIPTIRVEVASTQSTAAPAATAATAVEPFFAPAVVQADDAFRLVGALAEHVFEPDGCCLVRRLGGVPFAEFAAEEPLRPAPDAAAAPRSRDITAPARFRAAVAVTLRLTQASVAAARKARATPSPALTVRPAPPRRSADPARQPELALGAAGFAPVSGPDGRLGYLVLLVVGIGFIFAFADATRSVAADVRASGEDPDPPPDRPG